MLAKVSKRTVVIIWKKKNVLDQASPFVPMQYNKEPSQFFLSRLLETYVGETTAAIKNSLSCAFFCLKHLACFSFNFAAFPDKTGKFTCEILSSDKYNNSKSLLPGRTFHHFSIVVSNLSLNFALIFDEPECLIKQQNSKYPIRD